MAVSGIDHTIKIFSPDAHDQQNARNGVGVKSADPDSFSSISFGRRRRARHSNTNLDVDATLGNGSEDDSVATNGLTSRKRMRQSYQIMSQNDIERRGGGEDAFITVSYSRILSRTAFGSSTRGRGAYSS
jgi:DDB1- and CUL4-associated factor 6